MTLKVSLDLMIGIFDFLSVFTETLLFYMFLCLFMIKRYYKKKYILCIIIIYCGFQIFFNILIGDNMILNQFAIKSFFFMLTDIGFCFILFKIDKEQYRSIVYTSLFYITVAFIESFIFTLCFICMPSYNILDVINETKGQTIFLMSLFRLTEYAFIVIVKKLWGIYLLNLKWSRLLIISILSLIFTQTIIPYYWQQENDDIFLLLIILELFIGAVNIFIVYFVIMLQKATEKYVQIQAAIERRSNFILMMSALQDSVRQITHNIRDKLTVPLLLWINRGDYDKAREILFEYDRRLINFYPIKLTGNFDIDALLLIKSQEAKMHDIDFHIRGICKESINLPLDELGSLLGCAIDNAIEATRNINNEKIINIYITQNSYRLLIVVSNPHNGDIRTNRFGDIISTKESGGGNGINIMRKIAQKYDGDIDIEHSDSKFSLRITLMISTSYVENTSEEESSLK